MANELRLLIFLSVLATMLALELFFPARRILRKKKRALSSFKKRRLVANYGLMLIASLSAKVLLPIGLAGVALYCSTQQWGLFNVINLPLWLTFSGSILLLDVIIYWQHRLLHQLPFLWKLHQVHHADTHIDATTALRFHPLEMLLSLAVKGFFIVLLGVPATAVIIFEILLSAFAIFNHANIRLPKHVERLTRTILVTQMLHRIHHSQRMSDSNSNFGFSVIWWDKLFGSYKAKSIETDSTLKVGLATLPDTHKNAHLWQLLTLPFRK